MRIVLVVALLFMVGRLVDVQIIHSGAYQTDARNESHHPTTLSSLRGGIYARDGAPLALSVPTNDVIADDFQVAHPMKTALVLSPLLGIPATTLAPELRRHSGYVVLAKQISQRDGQKIAADAIPGITLEDDSKRVVTNGDLASPVIGFTNAANKGAAGIEYADNRLLSGTASQKTVIESPSGVALPSSGVGRAASRAGVGVELTLDTQLQYESEQVLAQAIQSSQALSGTAVVMDVKTGQILSMANLVSTHPKAPGSATAPAAASTAGGVIPIGPKGNVKEAANNNAVTQLYEPGSVFKLVTFSAALQDGLINPNSIFTVPDQITLDGSSFHDADPHPTEQLTATQILAQSSNIGTSQIAQGLGEQRLLDQVGNLGFGKATGLDFPGESAGSGGHRGPVGADGLRVPAHRTGRRRQRDCRSSTPTTRSPTTARSSSPSWCRPRSARPAPWRRRRRHRRIGSSHLRSMPSSPPCWSRSSRRERAPAPSFPATPLPERQGRRRYPRPGRMPIRWAPTWPRSSGSRRPSIPRSR